MPSSCHVHDPRSGAVEGGGGGGKEQKGESEGQWVNGNEIHARTRERRDREW